MVGREHGQHRLAAQLVALGALGPARLGLGVLEAHRRVQRRRPRPPRPSSSPDPSVGLDLDLGELLAQPRDRGRDDGGERARERADAQRLALGGGQLGDLGVGLREPVGDRVGVGEQQRARLGRRRAARPAVEQPHAELALERS